MIQYYFKELDDKEPMFACCSYWNICIKRGCYRHDSWRSKCMFYKNFVPKANPRLIDMLDNFVYELIHDKYCEYIIMR